VTGHPITEQNLSEQKNGHKKWCNCSLISQASNNSAETSANLGDFLWFFLKSSHSIY